MKHFFKTISVIAALFAAYSCTPEQAEAVIDFLGGDTEYTVPAEGGSVAFDFECDQDWYTSIILPVTELENDWFSVSGMHGDAGTGHIEVTLKANPRDTERTLEVQITAGVTKSAKIKVTQLAKGSNGGGGYTGGEDSQHVDTKIEVSANGITSKSAYFAGTVACDAPAGYESKTPQIGFMISSDYKTVEEIYEYGKWIWPFTEKTTGDPSNCYRVYVSDLAPGTTYYLFLCAEYENDKSYKTSKLYTFTTSVVKTDLNGHESVDLGLSVKWAKCNVGAKDEYSLGGYYSWGETSAKSSYNPRDYKYWAGKSSSGWDAFTKYVTKSDFAYEGKIDNLVCLETQDDAARAIMGGTWRVPHDSELQELIDKCTWEREYTTAADGTKTYTAVKVTGPNGNHIVLPFGGNMSGTSALFMNQGHYMGAEISVSQNYSCCDLNFTTGNIQKLVNNGREAGLNIRAVTD